MLYIRQNCKHIFPVTTITFFVYAISQTGGGVNILINIISEVLKLGFPLHIKMESMSYS
jgi:hypothetical protein